MRTGRQRGGHPSDDHPWRNTWDERLEDDDMPATSEDLAHITALNWGHGPANGFCCALATDGLGVESRAEPSRHYTTAAQTARARAQLSCTEQWRRYEEEKAKKAAAAAARVPSPREVRVMRLLNEAIARYGPVAVSEELTLLQGYHLGQRTVLPPINIDALWREMTTHD